MNENPQDLHNRDCVALPDDHQLNRCEIQAEDRQWDSEFQVEIYEFSGNLST